MGSSILYDIVPKEANKEVLVEWINLNRSFSCIKGLSWGRFWDSLVKNSKRTYLEKQFIVLDREKITNLIKDIRDIEDIKDLDEINKFIEDLEDYRDFCDNFENIFMIFVGY